MKCKLCGQEKKLRNSHIIPEFFYKPMYDEKHRFNVIPLSEGQKLHFKQKGLREKLLCEDCEVQLSVYEKYVRSVFYGGTGIYITNGNPLKIEGIDYKKFKLFQLSLLYRAAVSSLDFFQNVALGPHLIKIRNMLLNENPGNKLDYPCFMVMILMEGNKILDGLIYPPQMMRVDAHRVYRFILGGCFWIYFVSSHTNQVVYTEFILDESGKVLIPLKKAEDTHFFRELAKNIVKFTKK
ncbi:MAG: hypothetical protein GXO78_04170 [Calditrichaeota bacterium]|nr:hypothetical protein [Calditrichota bacterium]